MDRQHALSKFVLQAVDIMKYKAATDSSEQWLSTVIAAFSLIPFSWHINKDGQKIHITWLANTFTMYHLLLLMKINSWTRWYCLVRSQSLREHTHTHKYARTKHLWTNHNCSSTSYVHQCQGHEIAPDAAWLWVRVQELIISNNTFSIYHFHSFT